MVRCTDFQSSRETIAGRELPANHSTAPEGLSESHPGVYQIGPSGQIDKPSALTSERFAAVRFSPERSAPERSN